MIHAVAFFATINFQICSEMTMTRRLSGSYLHNFLAIYVFFYSHFFFILPNVIQIGSMVHQVERLTWHFYKLTKFYFVQD